MSRAAYHVRGYENGDDEKIVSLLDTAFDGWPKFDIQCSPLEHWRWKYLDNPLGPVLVFVVEKEGEIVGSNHLIPCLVNIERNTILSGNDTDVCTHPDHRRKGVYNRILDYYEPIVLGRGIIFWYGIETNPFLIKKNIQEGTDKIIPHKATLYFRIKDVNRHLKMTSLKNPNLKKMGFNILNKKNAFKKRFYSINTLSSYDIKRTNFFDEKTDSLNEQVKDFFGYYIERNSVFLKWRYLDSRGGKYEIWSAINNGVLLGFIVSRINRYQEDYPTGHILDLVFKPGRMDVADSLLKTALSNFDDNGVNIVFYLGISGNPLDSLVKLNSFVESRERLLWSHASHSDVTEYANILRKLPSERIYFSYGDIDWI